MRAAIIRFSSLGDIVLSTSVVGALANTGWAIAFITKRQYAPLLRHDPRIQTVIEFDGFQQTARKIKEFQPDLIIDLHRSMRSTILSGFTGIRVVRANKHSIRRRLLVQFGIGNRAPKSVADLYSHTLRKLNINSDIVLPKLFPTSD